MSAAAVRDVRWSLAERCLRENGVNLHPLCSSSRTDRLVRANPCRVVTGDPVLQVWKMRSTGPPTEVLAFHRCRDVGRMHGRRQVPARDQSEDIGAVPDVTGIEGVDRANRHCRKSVHLSGGISASAYQGASFPQA